MKKVKLFISIALILFYLLGLSSCIAPPRGFSGKGTPKGWNKNSKNPHHPKSTNPGKGHHKNK
ncbi:MAG: hypothetical protein Q8M08_03325 [Bacteroidales bacterium]|nr:hypothetical protein [Bacteroidales bacterium]